MAIGGAIVVALVLAFTLKTKNQLSMRTNPMIVWTVAVTAVGAGLAVLRRRDPVKGALTGAFFGWLLGSFGGAIQGVADNRVETILAFVVAAVLLGARVGLTENPDVVGKANIDNRSRSWLFVGPAFLFISVMLILPTIQTVILSTQSNKPIDPQTRQYENVGFDNYQSVFGNDDNFDTAGMSTLFTSDDSTSIFPWGGSAILPWALFFLAAGILLAVAARPGDRAADQLRRRSAAAADPGRHPLLVRALHPSPGHDHQQPVVGGRRDRDRHQSRARGRQVGRRRQVRARRQVVRVHADGHLDGRRVDHLATDDVSGPRRLEEPDRPPQRRLGVAGRHLDQSTGQDHPRSGLPRRRAGAWSSPASGR